jgi:hypothetical protein
LGERQILEPVQVAEEKPSNYHHNKLASFSLLRKGRKFVSFGDEVAKKKEDRD